MFGRTFLYHETCPDGKIIADENEYLKLKEEGWVEAKEDIKGYKPKRKRAE